MVKEISKEKHNCVMNKIKELIKDNNRIMVMINEKNICHVNEYINKIELLNFGTLNLDYRLAKTKYEDKNIMVCITDKVNEVNILLLDKQSYNRKMFLDEDKTGLDVLLKNIDKNNIIKINML